MNDEGLNKEEFLKLPTGRIRQLVVQKKRPQTGIFVADGNRRLVMTQTGLTPDSDDFYDAYLKIVTQSFMKSLSVFFAHGLNTLIFPLFGPSLLKRDEKYRHYVMPGLVHTLFATEEWMTFYKKHEIRVKTYGNTYLLKEHFKDPDLVEVIKQGENRTFHHQKYRLFYGFFSGSGFDMSLIRLVNRFIREHNREPRQVERVKLYYGEAVAPADFFITSIKPGALGALPPLLYGKETRMYTLIAPGVFAFNENTYREILYDLLFLDPGEPGHTGHNTGESHQEDIDSLRDFYQQNQNRVMGTGKIIGKWWVLND